MKIIAVETSHDDTSVVIYEDKKIICEFSYTQTEFHKKFGGTVPEYAARGHAERLVKIANDLKSCDLSNVDHVAYTNNPGLIGSLHTGKIFAKAIAYSLGITARPINHMYGHIYAAAFNHEFEYPAISLIVSGGHTQLWLVKSVNSISLLGQTHDDALGEVYDKVARRLKIGFPGGPVIDKNAKLGSRTIDFSLLDSKDMNFSFSGLKTKVINYINKLEQKNQEININDICHSFQEAAIDDLIIKTQRAIELYKPQSIILGGGVSANSRLRERFKELHHNALIPEMRYTTDNAMMIAIRSHYEKNNGV